MLALLMIFAAVWGVLQLWVLGSFTRTVRVRSVLGAVAVGFYACATVSVGLQWLLTRLAVRFLDAGLKDVVITAGYTIDPVIEEVVKVVPLLVAGWWFRSKSQWGVTDFVLMGSGFGAGFGLFEMFARYGQFLSKFSDFPGGFVRANTLTPPFIPNWSNTVTSWLPASVSQLDLFAIEDAPAMAPHVVWSSIAGLGVGLFFKAKTRFRVAGLLLVLVASFHHMVSNYAAAELLIDVGFYDTYGGRFMEPFVGPSDLVVDVFWVWPVLVMATAVGFDLKVLRRTRPGLAQYVTLEPTAGVRLSQKLAYAGLKPVWTAPIVWQHTLMLRSASYGLHNDSAELAESLVVDGTFMQATNNRQVWRDVTLKQVWAHHRKLFRFGWSQIALIGLWLLLLSPSILYFVAGGNPGSGIQERLASTWGLRITLGVMVVGLVWVGWQTRTWFKVLRSQLNAPSNTILITAFYRLLIGVSVVCGGLITLNVRRTANPYGPADERFINNNFHVLAALAILLLIAAIALVIAAFILFPPSIALVGIAGTGLAVPIVSVSGGFLGFTAAATAVAAGSAYAYDQSQQAHNQPDQAANSSNSYNSSKEQTDSFSEALAKSYENPNNRPNYGPGQVEEVWERAKDADGLVRDPNTDQVLEWDRSKPRTGQWDMGHIGGEEYRKLHKKYIEGEITKEEFLREYRNPDNYKPEDPSENRSGKHEAD